MRKEQPEKIVDDKELLEEKENKERAKDYRLSIFIAAIGGLLWITLAFLWANNTILGIILSINFSVLELVIVLNYYYKRINDKVFFNVILFGEITIAIIVSIIT